MKYSPVTYVWISVLFFCQLINGSPWAQDLIVTAYETLVRML